MLSAANAWMKRTGLSLLGLLALASAQGCTKAKENQLAQVTLTLPAVPKSTKTLTHPPKISTMTSQSWGVSDPTTSGDVLCYAIAVTAPDLPALGSCTDTNDTEVLRPAIIKTLFSAGQTISLSLTPGSQRKFYLIGFAASSASACTAENGMLVRSSLSAPFILATAEHDLLPGTTSRLAMKASLASATKLNDCPWEIAPRAVISNAPSGVSLASSLNITISGDTVASYRYKIISSGTCASDSGYSAPVSIATPITDSMANFSSGPLTLCVLGRSASGREQSLSQASFAEWSKAITIGFSQNLSVNPEAASTTSVSLNLSEPAPANLTVAVGLSGSAVLGTDVSGLTTPLTVPIAGGATSAVINLNLLTNAGSTLDKILRFSISGATGSNLIRLGDSPQTTMLIEDTTGAAQNGVKEVATSKTHTCSLTNGGVVYCWGTNTHGLGDNSHTTSSSPVAIGSGFVHISANPAGDHTCAIKSDSTLWCWGANSRGQLGNNSTTSSPVPVQEATAATNWISVSVGKEHTCAINLSNVAKCWGANSSGQIGDGTSGTDRPVPTSVTPVGSFYLSLSAGNSHTCTIRVGGILKCWGDGSMSQLGNGSTANQVSPVEADAGVTYSKVSAGGNSTCGITTANALKCWGSNADGHLGNGSIDTITTPTVIDSSVAYASISVSEGHSCGVTTSNQVRCWGNSNDGQLGDGSTTFTLPPEKPKTIDSTTSYSIASVGTSHTCALTTDGYLKCWGRRTEGQLGDGKTSVVATPLAIDTDLTFSSIALGNSHGCAITTSGALKCWGVNTYGQVGDSSTTLRTYPILIDPGVSYTAVDAGQSITCGLTSAGALKCWGTHGSGAGVGDGSTASRVNPTTVIDGGVTAFAVGSSHTCAIKAGALKCWGLNTYGQLGDGTQTTRLAPTEILASGVTMVAAGGESTCAVVGGLLKCWGRNSSGQLGDGTLTQSLSPVTTDTSAGTITSLSLGDSHGCMVKGGALRCWGHNDFGQVGNGSPSSSPVTTATTIGTGYAAVTAGGSHNCALLAASNTLKCWGANSSSNLGNGSTTDLSSPTAIDAGVSYSVTAAGGNHSCGIVLLDSNTPALPAGALKCWGSNSMGQVGDGATLFVPSIVPDVRR